MELCKETGRPTRGKEETGYIARSDVESDRTDDKTNHRYSHHNGNMPSPFIKLARGYPNSDTDGSGDQGRRAGEDKRDDFVKTERAYDGREELWHCQLYCSLLSTVTILYLIERCST